jgi:hypothetical protein
MSKVKMRCAHCGKPFKSSDAKQTLCPDCTTKERAARAQKAAAQPVAAARPAQAPKIVGPGATLLGATPTATTVDAPPDRGAFGSAARVAQEGAERRAHEHGQRHDHHAGHHADHHAASSPAPTRPQPTTHAKPPARDGHPVAQPTARVPREHRPPPPPRAPRQPKSPPQPQELTAAQRAHVEQRYLELAQPVEFDGIRTRIATELGLPKALVRKAVLDLRKRLELPSWWEMQGFSGSQADLERVRAAYMPYLPVPPVGIHKQVAEQLQMEPHTVYKAIRQIRAGMRLPQFNPPEAHPEMTAKREVTPPAGV